MNNEIFIMIGAPCSGKSYVGKKLAKLYDIPYYSSGDIARQMGVELNDGQLAPEARMREEIRKLVDNNDTFILDGFPRFIGQLYWLQRIDESRHQLVFIEVDCNLHELIRRNTTRTRFDAGAFSNRIRWYIDNTVPVMDEIRIQELPIIRCTSTGSIEALVDDIWRMLYVKSSEV